MQENFPRNFNLLNQAVLKSVNAPSEAEIIKNFTDVTIKILKADYGFAFFRDIGKKEKKVKSAKK